MSPFASSIVLPCSDERMCASSSSCSRMRAWSLNITRARLETDVADQLGNAAAAASTAAFISARVAWGAVASSRCVAGHLTGMATSPADSTKSPPMRSGTRFAGSFARRDEVEKSRGTAATSGRHRRASAAITLGLVKTEITAVTILEPPGGCGFASLPRIVARRRVDRACLISLSWRTTASIHPPASQLLKRTNFGVRCAASAREGALRRQIDRMPQRLPWRHR